MRRSEKSLRSISKNLAAIAEKLVSVSQQLEGKGKTSPKLKPNSGKKPTPKKAPRANEYRKIIKASATGVVLQFINESEIAVNMAAIEKATSFNKKKLQHIVFSLKKQGKAKRVARGMFEKA